MGEIPVAAGHILIALIYSHPRYVAAYRATLISIYGREKSTPLDIPIYQHGACRPACVMIRDNAIMIFII